MQHTGFGASVPVARIEDLVITESADEVLVYDKQRHEIHHLNQASAAVWRLCDGKRSVADLAREANVDVEIAQLAVNKLAEANLLKGNLSSSLMLSSQSRRKILKRAGLAGAGAAIVSISAPLAAAAANNCINPNSCNAQNIGRCCAGTIASVCASTEVAGRTVFACVMVSGG